MLNKYPWWKYALVVVTVVAGLLYALPNLYGDDPGIQIRGTRTQATGQSTLTAAKNVLKNAQIPLKLAALGAQGLQLRFANTDQQLKARDVLERKLGEHYTVALTLLPATPRWLEAIGAKPMFLGLDLRGGVHFLMQVDMASALQRSDDSYVDGLRTLLREQKIRYNGVRRVSGGGVDVVLRKASDLGAALKAIASEYPELELKDEQRDGASVVHAAMRPRAVKQRMDLALEQNMTALRNRIDELGVAEPVVQRQGDQRIVVELPGVQDTARAKRILGRTATLEVYMVDEDHGLSAAVRADVPAGDKLYHFQDGRPILLKRGLIYSGENIVNAAASVDTRTGGPIVSITLDSKGANINQRVTGENVGKRMAVVYVELRSEVKRDANGKSIIDKQGREVRTREKIEQVITAPVIRGQLGKRFQIEGIGSMTEARDLALLLRAGSLAAPVEIVEERTVGPSLGRDNITQGFRSVVVGFALVLVFMAFYYRMFGWVANIALALNMVLLVALLSLLQATLTLPGVAGIVLTVGMAVDANVLIFERIREELRSGNTPQASIHSGYERAWTTIVDANVTTLIAAVVLFALGTGPVKGFAVTLSLGILTSMFTGIMVSRAIVNYLYGGKRLKSLSI